MKFSYPIVLISLVFMLSSCGGDSDSSGSGGGSDPVSGGGSSSRDGQFIDSAVTGLQYLAGDSQDLQLTGGLGEFFYSEGQSVTFSIGGKELGTTIGSQFVTPEGLAAGLSVTSAEKSRYSVNLTRFLLTIDDDGDLTTGIVVAGSVSAAAADSNINLADFYHADFDSTDSAQFARNIDLEFGRAGQLASDAAALSHLEESNADLEDGQFDNDKGKDSDSDGVNDVVDACPNSSGSIEFSGCANSDELAADTDGDGIANGQDNCPAVSNNQQLDLDNDSVGDACDSDADGDGLLAITENDIGTSDTNVDTDGDNVSDKIDQFPLDGTRSEDADRDGVEDSGDNCPINRNTDQSNVDGDTNGDACDTQDNRDGDNDGVQNYLDRCPATEPDSTVDSDGCSDDDLGNGDSDGDGVIDNSDSCEATPKNETADANGCSQSQRDTDSDGVKDSLDQCPATTEEASVDSNGCSAAQKDTDDDGVSDAEDECPNTSPGEMVGASGCSLSDQLYSNRGTEKEGIYAGAPKNFSDVPDETLHRVLQWDANQYPETAGASYDVLIEPTTTISSPSIRYQWRAAGDCGGQSEPRIQPRAQLAHTDGKYTRRGAYVNFLTSPPIEDQSWFTFDWGSAAVDGDAASGAIHRISLITDDIGSCSVVQMRCIEVKDSDALWHKAYWNEQCDGDFSPSFP